MKKSILTYLALSGLGISCSYAQLVTSGEALSLSENSLIYVSGDFINTSGVVKVSKNASFEVTGNIFNKDINSVAFTTDSKGTVILSGDYQEIDGERIIFPGLTLKGTAAKALKTDIDISETGIFTLDGVQLDADDKTVFLKNPMPDALVRIGRSFISTSRNGAFIRKTNSDQEYLFPLASTNLNQALQGVDTLYRPVYFKPENSFENSFSASLVNEDPTMSGYDKSKKRYDVKNVSDKYFYLLGQKEGTSKFDVAFYQNTAVEEGYSQLVSWGNFLLWEKAAPSRVETGTYFDDLNSGVLNQKVQFSSIQSFTEMPFTFSSEQGGVNPFTFFNAFSPDGDNKNDTWKINNIELYPDNKLTIYNRWGDEVYSVKGYTNDKAWDGGNLQSGTYYYVLTATVENQARVFKGFITMIKKN